MSALNAIARGNPPQEMRDAADEALKALRAADNAAQTLLEELKRAVSAPPATGGMSAPELTGGISGGRSLGVGGSPNSFDSDVLNFHVKLDSGSVDRLGQNLGLRGVVSIWPKNNPSLKLTLRDAAVTVKSAGSGFNSVGGAGKLELSIAGQTITFDDASFDSTPDGNTLNGTGKFQRFNHTFDISYAINGQNFTGQGEWHGRGKGWQSVPGVEAEYQLSNPVVKVNFSGANISTAFDADKLEVKTKAKNPNGDPWAKAEANPESLAVTPDGRFPLPLPSLPQPQDLNRKAREACEAAARNLRQDTKPCSNQFPGPPGLPNLPARIDVQLSSVIE